MSCNRYAHHSSSDASPWGCHGRTPWSPVELTAMILGFILFWPIGLAILFWKKWQRRAGYSGDFFTFARERTAGVRQSFGFDAASATPGAEPSGAWRGPAFMHATGNSAFDAWRENELARLEAERRKLAEAERDFAEHIDQLRRARDRDEFDSFMRARSSGETPTV